MKKLLFSIVAIGVMAFSAVNVEAQKVNAVQKAYTALGKDSLSHTNAATADLFFTTLNRPAVMRVQVEVNKKTGTLGAGSYLYLWSSVNGTTYVRTGDSLSIAAQATGVTPYFFTKTGTEVKDPYWKVTFKTVGTVLAVAKSWIYLGGN